MTRLMSHWTSAISPATRSVAAPRIAARAWMSGAASKIGCARTSRYTPAVTIVAAWMRAETGVGPSIASGSHVWSGICADLATAPPSRPSAMRLTIVDGSPSTSSKTATYSSVPVSQISRTSASANVASPIAFMTNAFFAAATASGRWCQNPMSRYDARPTSPHPTSRSRKFPACTSRSIEKTKNDM